jgi:hypothetical protein
VLEPGLVDVLHWPTKPFAAEQAPSGAYGAVAEVPQKGSKAGRHDQPRVMTAHDGVERSMSVRR